MNLPVCVASLNPHLSVTPSTTNVAVVFFIIKGKHSTASVYNLLQMGYKIFSAQNEGYGEG